MFDWFYRLMGVPTDRELQIKRGQDIARQFEEERRKKVVERREKLKQQFAADHDSGLINQILVTSTQTPDSCKSSDTNTGSCNSCSSRSSCSSASSCSSSSSCGGGGGGD